MKVWGERKKRVRKKGVEEKGVEGKAKRKRG